MFVLDTNTLIDFFKGKGNVASKLLSAPPSEIALAAVAAYEVWVGVLGSRDAKRRQTQFESFLSLINVVPFDAAASRGAAEVRLALERRGEPIGPLDTLIAGTALAQNASLVTRNVKEFGRVPGLKVVNWYD